MWKLNSIFFLLHSFSCALMPLTCLFTVIVVVVGNGVYRVVWNNNIGESMNEGDDVVSVKLLINKFIQKETHYLSLKDLYFFCTSQSQVYSHIFGVINHQQKYFIWKCIPGWFHLKRICSFCEDRTKKSRNFDLCWDWQKLYCNNQNEKCNQKQIAI